MFKKSLILNIGAAVLLVEFVVLTSLGLFYTERFATEIDRYLENSISLPGELMNRQLLRYESVNNQEIMAELVGDEFLDGMVIGADGRVFYAHKPELVGKSIIDIPDINPNILTGVTDPLLMYDTKKETITAITPVHALEKTKPYFLVYIKAGTKEAKSQKRRIAALFIFGSAICIILTSLAIITHLRRQVTKPLSDLKENADAMRRGERNAAITVDREDEIGSLSKSFISMHGAINQKIDELETANLALEEREGHLQAMVEAFPDRIIILDWEGFYINVYATERDDVFHSENNIVGRRIHDIHPKTLADRALAVVRRTITTGTSQDMDYYLEGPNGRVWFESRTSRIGDKDGEAGRVIWVARDITYRKDIEQRLTRAKEDAERISIRLRELDKTKSALVSSVSHELRTPLTSLLGFSKLILKNFSKNFWPLAKGDHTRLTKGAQIIENLNILIHEGNRLTRLINDVLDLNKIEMGYTEWREEKVNPAELAKNAANAVSGQFNDNPHLTLVTQIDSDLPSLVVDADRMLQVLLNILTNAAKFTPSGMVTLRTNSPVKGVVRFEVEDTGPGIHTQEQERIFEVFHQAKDSAPTFDKPLGAGLGLAICREIIEHHNGTIWVESTPGHGATFIIELPVG